MFLPFLSTSVFLASSLSFKNSLAPDITKCSTIDSFFYICLLIQSFCSLISISVSPWPENSFQLNYTSLVIDMTFHKIELLYITQNIYSEMANVLWNFHIPLAFYVFFFSDWERTVHNNLALLTSSPSESLWPRDTLFRYFQLMEALMENLQERQDLQDLACKLTVNTKSCRGSVTYDMPSSKSWRWCQLFPLAFPLITSSSPLWINKALISTFLSVPEGHAFFFLCVCESLKCCHTICTFWWIWMVPKSLQINFNLNFNHLVSLIIPDYLKECIKLKIIASVELRVAFVWLLPPFQYTSVAYTGCSRGLESRTYQNTFFKGTNDLVCYENWNRGSISFIFNPINLFVNELKKVDPVLITDHLIMHCTQYRPLALTQHYNKEGCPLKTNKLCAYCYIRCMWIKWQICVMSRCAVVIFSGLSSRRVLLCTTVMSHARGSFGFH